MSAWEPRCLRTAIDQVLLRTPWILGVRTVSLLDPTYTIVFNGIDAQVKLWECLLCIVIGAELFLFFLVAVSQEGSKVQPVAGYKMMTVSWKTSVESHFLMYCPKNLISSTWDECKGFSGTMRKKSGLESPVTLVNVGRGEENETLQHNLNFQT